jgi:hypothetical protein
MIERHLMLAETHVVQGLGNILKQREILTELERDGHLKAASLARKLLATFEVSNKIM